MKLKLSALAASLLFAAGAVQAAYPDRPVRVVVGFSPGGPTDVVARAFASYASQALGQTFVVENRPGANTILAAETVAKSAPDGYTLLFGATNHTMIPALYADRVRFDALKSFTPLCAVAVSPTVLVTGPSLKVKTLDAFLARARAEPGRLTYATPGTGSSGHFATAQFLRQTGIQMNHIPYKGAAQAVSDLMGGQVDSSLATLGSVLPQIQSGKLTALAVAAPGAWRNCRKYRRSTRPACRATVPTPGMACWPPRAWRRTCAPSWSRRRANSRGPTPPPRAWTRWACSRARPAAMPSARNWPTKSIPTATWPASWD